MSTVSMSFASFSFLATGILAVYYVWRKSHRPHFPPGPRGVPVLGNVFDTPPGEPWKAYKKLGEKYGDIIHLRVLTQDMIVLNSYEVIKDLFEHRSQNYSNRPYIPAFNMVDYTWGTGFLPYGDEWKIHRKMFQQAYRPENLPGYRAMQMSKTRDLLRNMCDSPANFVQHFRSYSTAISMAATYDYHPAPRDDPMVDKLKIFAETAVDLLAPLQSMVFAACPFLMYLPSWFPGAPWLRTADKGRKVIDWWLSTPVESVQERMREGDTAPCLVGDALSRIDGKHPDAARAIQLVKGAAASSLLAASDTTDSAMQVLVLAMVLHPDVQKRAHAEIQAVVGSERLPAYSDRPNLPYIEAVYRETLRWHPVLPFSVVRSVVEDDVYRGYSFPKGVWIIPNLWAVMHDEAKYLDPSVFNPGRFFDDQGNLNDDTVPYAFGFGRRVCAGRPIADASLWSALVNLLALFSFEAPLDETGKAPVKIVPKFTAGFTSHPEPFPVNITMRLDAEKVASLLATHD
ncbi:Cytochrome P450 [Tylopilus felleus]